MPTNNCKHGSSKKRDLRKALCSIDPHQVETVLVLYGWRQRLARLRCWVAFEGIQRLNKNAVFYSTTSTTGYQLLKRTNFIIRCNWRCDLQEGVTWRCDGGSSVSSAETSDMKVYCTVATRVVIHSKFVVRQQKNDDVQNVVAVRGMVSHYHFYYRALFKRPKLMELFQVIMSEMC